MSCVNTVYQNGPSTKIGRRRTEHLDLGNAVRETEKQFSTDLQLLLTETTNDPSLLKILVCLERQQHENMPDEYSLYRKKVSTRYELVFFYENRIIVPKLLAFYIKDTRPYTKCRWRRDTSGYHGLPKPFRRNVRVSSPVKCPVRTLNLIFCVRKKINYHHYTNQTKKSNWISSVPSPKRTIYFTFCFSMDQFTKWPAATLCKTTKGQTTVRFLKQYIILNGVPKTIRTEKATALTGRTFREFCKNDQIKVLFGISREGR